MKSITISIRNWDLYNPRKDRKKHTWLRFQNTAYSSPELFGLSLLAKWTWTCVLSLASQKQSGQYEVDIAWLAHHVHPGTTADQVLEAITELDQRNLLRFEDVTPVGDFEVVTVRSPRGVTPVTDREPPGDRQTPFGNTTNERTNERLAVTASDHQPPPLSPKVTENLAAEFFTRLMAEYAGPPLKAKSVMVLSPKEKTLARQRLEEEPSHEHWQDVMRRATKSPYLCGQAKGSPFRFTLPFLLKPHAHKKILNGDYDAHVAGNGRERVEWEGGLCD